MTATAKAKYNFRSENEAEITFEHLINEMAANNTTVTKADTEAGSYTLSISAKPCTVQYTESFADEIEIS